jgi:hypothetical protein
MAENGAPAAADPAPAPAPSATPAANGAADHGGGADALFASAHEAEAGTPPAANGEAPPAANGEPAPVEFLALFSAEPGANGDKSNRDWITAKGFKDADALIASYRSAERQLHESGKIKVPGEGASAAELKAFALAIGTPEDAKGYVVAPPKDSDGKDIPLNTELIGRLAEAVHESGAPMPAKAFEVAVQAYAKMEMDAAADLDRDQMRKADAIAKGWGSGRADNMAALDRAVEALALTKKEVVTMRNVMGSERFIDRMLVLGHGLSESKLFGGDSQVKFGISAEEATARMDALKKQPGFAAKAAIKGSAEQIEWDRLQTILGEAANRKALQEV